MPLGLGGLDRKLGRPEKLFLVLLVLYIASYFLLPSSGTGLLIAVLFYATGLVVAVRLARGLIRKVLWRLRNRLIVAYLFIAVVPVFLILALVGIATYMVTGQVAVYLVSSELGRRNSALTNAADILARSTMPNQPEIMRRLSSFLSERYPKTELVVQGKTEFHYPADSVLKPPPPAWKDASGIVIQSGRVYSWAHVKNDRSEVTVVAPLTHEFLSELIPGLGDVSFLNFSPSSAPPGPLARPGRQNVQLDLLTGNATVRTPPKYMAADVQVTGFYPMDAAHWNEPGSSARVLLVVHTRTSAVLNIIFGQKMDWGQVALALFAGVAILFLIVELISLVIGISLTRNITGAVHELYQGTERVRVGDFSHRIPVEGNDQLAELALSFNTMTENLGKLIVVAKEKERLQSELEIAREVQNQLFPRNVPELKSFQITGMCRPARTVSGDYYDFMGLAGNSLAFAIGDVAGKGISAALLMAAIQSTMRTQLGSGVPMAAAAGNGGAGSTTLSTASLVSILNKQLYANTSAEKFATFYFGLYDEPSELLTYTNAGHLPPVLLHDGRPELLSITGTVVGAFPFSQYDEKQVRLVPGDVLVAYTDGIVEPENEYGEMFGESRLTDLLVKHARHDNDEIIARVMEAVDQWTGSGELQDDMTMLVARRL